MTAALEHLHDGCFPDTRIPNDHNLRSEHQYRSVCSLHASEPTLDRRSGSRRSGRSWLGHHAASPSLPPNGRSNFSVTFSRAYNREGASRRDLELRALSVTTVANLKAENARVLFYRATYDIWVISCLRSDCTAFWGHKIQTSCSPGSSRESRHALWPYGLGLLS